MRQVQGTVMCHQHATCAACAGVQYAMGTLPMQPMVPPACQYPPAMQPQPYNLPMQPQPWAWNVQAACQPTWQTG